MSYDIYYFRSSHVSAENVDDFLEADVAESDPNFISRSLMQEIKKDLENHGLVFETFEKEDEDYLELNFDTYQICISNSEIFVSLPYWHENGDADVQSQLKQISQLLIEKGFSGYDPQSERTFSDPNDFSTDFASVNEKVHDHFSPVATPTKRSGLIRFLKLALIGISAYLLVRLFASMMEKALR